MDIVEILRQLRMETWQIKIQLWQQSFLTPRWWFIAVTIAATYALWWKLTDKRRIVELLLYGSFVAVARVIYDNWGISSGRWTYVTDLVPLGYSLFLNDLTVIPLFMMLVYQYAPTWKAFLVLLVVVQGAISLLFWPLTMALGILVLHDWRLSYSFLATVVMTVTMRAIMIMGLKIQRDVRVHGSRTSPSLLVAEPVMKPADRGDDGEE